MQNGYVESFNGRMRDELLNETLFLSLDHARVVIAAGQRITTRRGRTHPLDTKALRPSPLHCISNGLLRYALRAPLRRPCQIGSAHVRPRVTTAPLVSPRTPGN